MRNLTIILILFISLLSCACGISETKAFRATSEFYYNNINTPAELNIVEVKVSNQEESLINNLLPIDLALTNFNKEFSKFNYVPTPLEIQTLIRDFPWLSGVALTNAEGNIISQEPAFSMKNLDFTVIAEQKSKLGDRADFAIVLNSDLGAEIVIASPLYKDTNLIGYFIAHFDPKTLAKLGQSPDTLVLLADKKLLWAHDPSLIEQTDFIKHSNNSIKGKNKKDQINFNWLTIYIADLPLVVGNISK